MKKKIGLLAVSLVIAVVGVVLFASKTNEDTSHVVDEVLSTESYKELPDSIKNVVREHFEDTGEILRLEENKKSGELYLNPDYVAYVELDKSAQAEYEVIPEPMLLDYAPLVSEEPIDDASYPAKFDLRNVGGVNYLNANGDQGSLGICWAFSSIAAVETHAMYVKKWPTVRLSERQVDYATSTDGIENYSNSFYGARYLGHGGNFRVAMRVLAHGMSAFNNSEFVNDWSTDLLPYATVQNTADSRFEVDSTISMPTFNSKDLDMTLANNIKDREDYINEVKSYVMNYGGAYAGTMSPQDKCGHYDSALRNYVIDVDTACYDSTQGHAMTIVGWDDDVTFSYCKESNGNHKGSTSGCASENIVNGKGAWLLRNSWGNAYSYIYLAYDSRGTSIGFVKSLTKKEDRNWTNSYVIGQDTGFIYSGKEFKLAETKIKGNELLKRIKFSAYDAKDGFTVRVINSNGSTVSSKRIAVSRPGYVTVDFSSDNIRVNTGYSIVIERTDDAGLIEPFLYVFTDSEGSTPYVFDNLTIGLSQSNDDLNVFLYTKNIPSKTLVDYSVEDPDGYTYNSSFGLQTKMVGVDKIYADITATPYAPTQDYLLYIKYDGKKLPAGKITVDQSSEYSYHTISFNANGGTGAVNSLSVPSNNASYHLRKNRFEREDYRFVGWNTKANGTGTNYTEGELVNIHANTTLYAKWQEITYLITTYPNDGSNSFDSYEIRKNEKLHKNTYTQDGFIFKGWNTAADGSGTSYTDEEVFTVKQDLTLYAQWEFDANTVMSSDTYDIKGTMVINVAPRTSLTAYLNSISAKAGYSMEVDMMGKSFIGTGSQAIIRKNGVVIATLINVVPGDVDGSGTIAMMDYIKVRNHLTDVTKKLTDPAQLLAADANGDDKVSMLDYIRIRNTILGN